MNKPFLIGSLLGKEELICVLCSEYYRDPRQLPCGDTFCRKCLQTIFDEKQAKTAVKLTSMLCPKCHAVTALPEIGVSGFPMDVEIRRKKEQFMEKLLDSARPSSTGASADNKSHSLPKMARHLVEQRQREEEAKRPSFMKHDWETHILGSFERPSTTTTTAGSAKSATDDLDYLKRNRPTFSPGTKRNLMVDGLIRSRRERSPHVGTRNAPSATPRFTPIDPSADLGDGHPYRPFSGSRPTRLASPRSKLNSGLHHKSDPGFDGAAAFRSATSPDGLRSPDFGGTSASRAETSSNNPPGGVRISDDVTDVSAGSERQSRTRRQVHFKDGQAEVNDGRRETTSVGHHLSDRRGGDTSINETKSEEMKNKINAGISISDSIGARFRSDAKPTTMTSSPSKPMADTNKVPFSFAKSSSATSPPTSSSTSSSSLSSADRRTASQTGSKSPVSPMSPRPSAGKPSTPTSHPEEERPDKTSPQRGRARSRQCPPSPVTASSSPVITSSSVGASSPIGASSPLSGSSLSSSSPSSSSRPSSLSSSAVTATSPVTGTTPSRDAKVETVQFSEGGRTSPGKVRKRPTIPPSLRSPGDKSTSPDARRPYLSPTRGRTSPNLRTSPRGSSTLPRNHRPNVFTFDTTSAAPETASAKAESPSTAGLGAGSLAGADREVGLRKTSSGVDGNAKASFGRVQSPSDDKQEVTAAHRDREMGRVVGHQRAERGRVSVAECRREQQRQQQQQQQQQPPTITTTTAPSPSVTRLQNTSSSSYHQSRPSGGGDKPSTAFSGSSLDKCPSRADVGPRADTDDGRRPRVAKKGVTEDENGRPTGGGRSPGFGAAVIGANEPGVDVGVGGSTERHPADRGKCESAARGAGGDATVTTAAGGAPTSAGAGGAGGSGGAFVGGAATVRGAGAAAAAAAGRPTSTAIGGAAYTSAPAPGSKFDHHRAAVGDDGPSMRARSRPDNATTRGRRSDASNSADPIKGRSDNGLGSAARVGDNRGQAGRDSARTVTSSARRAPTANNDDDDDDIDAAPTATADGASLPTSVAERNRINSSSEESRRPYNWSSARFGNIVGEKSSTPAGHGTGVETDRTQPAGATGRDIPVNRKPSMNIKSAAAARTTPGTGEYSCGPAANGVNGVSDLDNAPASGKLNNVNGTSERRGKIGLDPEADDECSDSESVDSGDDSKRSHESSWSAIYRDIYDDITREVNRERERQRGETAASNPSAASGHGRDVIDEAGGGGDALNASRDADQSSLRDDTTQTPGGRISSEERQLGGATRLEESPAAGRSEPDDDDDDDMTPESPLYAATELWRVEKNEYEMPTSLVALSDGTAVVAEFNGGRLQYYDESGACSHVVDGVKPFCIALTDDDQVIVADRKRRTICGFDRFGVDTIQWEDDRFKWISGIGCLSNGNLVIYNRDNYKVGIYSRSGEKLSEFGSYGERDTQLCMADFLAVDSKDRILLCDSGNHCIKVFDAGGRFLLRFGARGHRNGQMEWPKGICCDGNDNIVVADNRNRRLSLYSPDGRFIQQLVRNFACPYGVCLDRAGRLLGASHYALTGFSQLAMYRLSELATDEPDVTCDVNGQPTDQSAVDGES